MEYTHLGTDGAEGQPPVPRHDELRPADDRAGQLRDHGPGARARASTSSTPPTSTAGSKGEGVTEQIIGRWFAQGGGRREKVVLATKVYGEHGRLAERRAPVGARTSATPARTACAACRPTTSTCTRCTTSTASTPWDEIWQAMEMLVQQGKVIYVGSSNFAGWHIAQANEAREGRHFLGLVSEQSLYNLNDAHGRAGGAPRLRGLRPGRDPVEPAGRRAARRRAADKRRGRPRRRRRAEGPARSTAPQLEAYETLCAELGEQPGRRRAGVAAAPTRSSPRRSSARARSSSSTARCARSRSSSTRTRWQELDEIFPGPGGAAPEAYAW